MPATFPPDDQSFVTAYLALLMVLDPDQAVKDLAGSIDSAGADAGDRAEQALGALFDRHDPLVSGDLESRIGPGNPRNADNVAVKLPWGGTLTVGIQDVPGTVLGGAHSGVVFGDAGSSADARAGALTNYGQIKANDRA